VPSPLPRKRGRDREGAAPHVELLIDSLGAAGDGIATFDGARAFVPSALPGERVRASPAGRRGDALVFEADEWLSRSPERADPPCPHFGSCGGCAAQHMADGAYASWKTGLLVDALARAGFAGVPVAPLVRTPPGTRRRADFALSRQRDGSVRVGLHARRGAAVVDLSACLVLHPRLLALIAPLRALLAGLPALRRDGAGIVNLLDHGPDLLLRLERDPDVAARELLVEFARAHALVRLSCARGDEAPEPVAAHASATITLSGNAVAAPPGAFLQASREGEAAIIAAVLAHLPAKARRIADLYAGLGTLSFALAGRGSVAAFEGDAAAASALARATGGTRVRAVHRDLARQPLQPQELAPFDAVVLDPPFAGAAAQIATIAASRVRHVVYVSCNPAALARDARTLRRAGFGLVAAAPIDQFLWSAQLECVLHFSR
jgi:23S rRNA (uracil1939-C5)-methyltransferase